MKNAEQRNSQFVHAYNRHGMLTMCNRPTNTVKYIAGRSELLTLTTPPAPICPDCKMALESVK